ncbi:MAG: zinc ribbon domain-containing protein [Candidatus Heimdallarchaeota archaeon]|nr:MAG: zinc ribbon domain-containing protein [Candidatus Heimdallarchaeota archaeon]
MTPEDKDRDVESTTKCPHCDADVPLTPYCILCGHSLKSLSPDIYNHSNQIIICSQCRSSVPKMEFCILCGNKLVEISPIEKHSETTTCPLCRNEVPSSHMFCHLCGGKLKKKDEEGGDESVLCKRCWKLNPPSTEYCIHCGLKRQKFRSEFLERPFEGYQLELSHFFQPASFSISALRHGLSTKKIFPSKSIIVHSSYFGVKKSHKRAMSKFYRNFGGFDRENLINYLGASGLMLLVYIFWYLGRYRNLVEQIDPLTDGILTLFFGGVLLATLLMSPIWLSTFLIYRNSGYKVNFRLDSSRVFIAVIFNFFWMFIGGFGPIMLQVGDLKDPQERVILDKSFIKGVAWGAVFTVSCTALIGLLSLTITGIPGTFAGFLFQDHPIKSHVFTTFFSATWLSVILLLPFGDYFDKVIKRWNTVGYFILLAVGLILLTHSFTLISLLSQTTYRA